MISIWVLNRTISKLFLSKPPSQQINLFKEIHKDTKTDQKDGETDKNKDRKIIDLDLSLGRSQNFFCRDHPPNTLLFLKIPQNCLQIEFSFMSGLCYTVKLGYNKQGYNKLPVVTNKFFSFFQSQIHTCYTDKLGYKELPVGKYQLLEIWLLETSF